ncbi:hypothetical protein MJT46_016945 [Ovis ammon polii x Ovis aries]|nr:hypothetical protein MJT46_016945 [Ovis ammon polii x Ovis aries]
MLSPGDALRRGRHGPTLIKSDCNQRDRHGRDARGVSKQDEPLEGGDRCGPSVGRPCHCGGSSSGRLCKLREVWGPLHIPVAPFTPDTDKDPTLSGGPLSEWTNGGGHRFLVQRSCCSEFDLGPEQSSPGDADPAHSLKAPDSPEQRPGTLTLAHLGRQKGSTSGAEEHQENTDISVSFAPAWKTFEYCKLLSSGISPYLASSPYGAHWQSSQKQHLFEAAAGETQIQRRNWEYGDNHNRSTIVSNLRKF